MDQAVAQHRTEPAAAHAASLWLGFTVRGLIVRLLITLVTIVAVTVQLGMSNRQLPFHFDPKSTYGLVTPRAGVALPAGLQPGVHVAFADQTLATRAVLMAPEVTGTQAYPLVIHHAGEPQTIMVRTIRQPSEGPFLFVINLFSIMAILVLGLAALWRGRDWSAWGLAAFSLSVLIGSALGQAPLPPFFNLVAAFVEVVFTGPMTFIGLYLSSRALTARASARQQRGLWIYGAMALTMVCCEYSPIPMVLFAHRISGTAALNLLGGSLAALMLVVPLVTLASGYRGAPPEQRLRIRWVFTGTFLLIPQLATSFLEALWLTKGSEASVLVAAFRAVLTAVIFGTYAFAVLATRLVEVRIAVNRAVVFTALMGLVVGLLALVESLIENSALHGRAGLALEVAAPLILGIAFDQLQRRIEQIVDRVFFRREHHARKTLHEFVRDAGFIEQADVLVARMVTMFSQHAGGSGAVLYETRATMFERSAQHGQRWPDAIDGDDPALVRLRATLAPLDLQGVETALGADGLALPLALRGRLFGVLVCGPRSAGRYAQAEMAELNQAAREVGASLFALRARANEALVERLALGQVAPHDATIEARQLTGLTS
ncbi:hypothetical protein AruPA_15670 [Acidiphilium sp. PA]|uniref:hypothetical protein n=1 Tax=Acidiphilium sp. PA TaxID=2871705 RepID=UPI0022439B1A|nr:hypothetical protein [Acidiphilium sp. PA]MCW8308478.1 hypothetical protein [Acidiphilium sp. PA]